MKSVFACGYLAALALLTFTGLHAQEWSLDEAMQRCMLHNGIPGLKEFEPRAGETQYGATFYPSSGSGTQGDNPRMSGWCILVEEGRSEFVVKNAKEKKSTQRPWRIWYQVSTYAYQHNFFYARGLEWVRSDKADTFLANFPKEIMGAKVAPREVALGDEARIASARGDACLYVIRQPIHWTVRVSTRMQLGDLDYNDPQVMVRNNLGPNRQLTWPDVEKLGAKFSAAQARTEDVATRIAQQIVGSWDTWAARKIGPGPGFKGLFEDVRSFMIWPEEMPEGFEVQNHSPNVVAEVRSGPRRDVGLTYLRKVPSSLYLSIRCRAISPSKFSRSPLDEFLLATKAEFDHRPSVAGSPVPQTVSLVGADEVKLVRTERTRGDFYLVGRYGNFLFEVRTSDQTEEGLSAKAAAIAYATRILEKLGALKASPNTAVGVTLQLTATPAGLWADGRSKARLRLTVRDAAGKGLPGQFQLAARGGGSLGAESLTADASGIAETEYTAGTVPGTSVVTATGVAGSCSASICEGGLDVVPAQDGPWGVRADGKSNLPIVIRATGLDGKPISGLRVSLTTEENELPQRGTLAPAEVQLDASGRAQAVYTPPLIAAGAGFRMGDIYVNAAAQATGPPPASLTGQLRITVSGGEGATLLVQKDGFEPTRFPIALAATNSLLRGRLVARAPNGATFPLACASLRVVGADGKRAIGVGLGEADGAFSLDCVMNPQGGAGEGTDLPAPLEVPLDAALLKVFNGARESLNELNGAGFEIAPAARYLDGAPERLARCDPKGDPGQRPAAIGGAAYRLGLLAVYIRLVRNRQMEDLDWFMESVDPVVDELVGLVVDLSALEEKAKEKLGAQFDKAVWQRFKKIAVGRVLRMLNSWYRQNTRNLRAFDKKLQEGIESGEKLNESVGLPTEVADEGAVTPAGLLHAFVEPLDALTPDLKLPDPDGGDAVDLKTWFLKTLKGWLRKPLENAFRSQAQGVLNAVVRRFEKAGAGDGSLEGVTEAARNIFTTYQDDHLKLNIRNLDAELYRLDAKLFMDTVVKGIVIYLDARKTIAEAGVKALRNLTSAQFLQIQASVTAGGEKVDTAAKLLDGAFRVYQGQAWLRDAFRACEAVEGIAGELVR